MWAASSLNSSSEENQMSPHPVIKPPAALLFLPCLVAISFAQMPNPYGLAIPEDSDKKAAAAAIAEAAKNDLAVAVAIVDTAGTLVYYEKMDNTQTGSAKVAVDKARSAALFKRPTKIFEDALTKGNALPILRPDAAVPLDD